MTTEHTQGPWKVTDGGTAVYHEQTKQEIASVWTGLFLYERIDRYAPEFTDEERRANARLIAAAPELLGALEAALEHSVFMGRMIGESLGKAMEQRMRDAIAKARGEVVRA